MTIELWNSGELYSLLRDDRMDPVPSYFLDTFFTEEFYSDDQEIRFAELPNASRVLAPFVLPTEQGKPIFSRKAETVKAIRPPYLKPKDPVRAADAANILPSQVYRNGGTPPSLEERFNQRVLDVTQFHLRAIQMRKAWMAARAFIDGKVQIDYERDTGAALPSVLLDFGRDAGHTVVLNTTYWDDPDYDIMGDIEAWMDTMYLAKFGGSAAQMIVGARVKTCFRNNKGIKALMSTLTRGSEDITVYQGIMRTEQPIQYVGTLGVGLTVWSYRDYVQNANGTMVDILDPRDVVLVAPGATGVKAHGAIINAKALAAGLSSVDVFPSMWVDDDPADMVLMHESSPLPIPNYPNRTFKARVLA